MSEYHPIRRALLSVWEKEGLDVLVPALHRAGAALVATGSTADAIAAMGVPVQRVEEVTGSAEMLGGRVKTLHPRIHAGLLADRSNPGHVAELAAAEIEPFDLVVCTLYPFESVTASGAASEAEAVEHIDIGGVTMLRAAAKGFKHATVVCDRHDYPHIVEALSAGGTSLDQRRVFAAKAFERTAAYDAAIADWFGAVTGKTAASVAGASSTGAATGAGETKVALSASGPEDEETGLASFEETFALQGLLRQQLRYGENPSQAAAFYVTGSWGLAGARQLHGKELSYNNLLDADAAYGLAREFAGRHAVAIIKHTNPCGLGLAEKLEIAYERALEGDPVSAYGGIVAAGLPIDEATAARISQVFTEVVLAPGFTPEALEILKKKPSLRLLQVDLEGPARWQALRSIAGGILVQDADRGGALDQDWELAAGPRVNDAAMEDLRLAWQVAAHVKSNAIVLVRDGRVVGVGAGQMSRVDSVRIALSKAGDRSHGAVAASDAFFPFPDNVEVLAAGGIVAVVQPGGSVHDDDVRAAATAASVSLLHTGQRHFRH